MILSPARVSVAGRTALLALLLALSRCVSYSPALAVPELTLSAEDVTLVSPRGGAGTASKKIDFGVEVGANESDSLFDLATLPGVRVRGLDAGGAAEAAGLRVGDIILSIEDTKTNAPDAVRLIETSAEAGTFAFEVRRDTTVFAASVVARAARSGAAPVELYRIDPLATRAAYRTEALELSGAEDRLIAAARVVEILDMSPLTTANIKLGETIVALQGREISSAQDFITRINTEHSLGERVSVDVFDGSEIRRESLQLWHPGRRLSSLSLGPLARYQSSSPEETEFTLGNLWLFSLYNYRKSGGEKTHRLLGLIEISSGYGELIEEPQP